MTRLQRYILLDTLKATVPAFAALVLIMVVGFCMQLLHDGLDVVRLRPLLPPLVVYCVPMVLPSALLTAVIMVLGRLSADNEVLAMRAAGIHLFSVVWPLLATALVLSGVAVVIQFEALPRARGQMRALKYYALQQILLDSVELSGNHRVSCCVHWLRCNRRNVFWYAGVKLALLASFRK